MPFILMVAPLLVTSIVSLIGSDDFSSAIVLSTFMLSWLPVLNPLLAMYFVDTYRDAILLRRKPYRLRPASSTPDTVASEI